MQCNYPLAINVRNLFYMLSLLVPSAWSFDLSSAYTSSLNYNAKFLAAVAKNQAGQEEQVQGRSQLLPQISATGALTENYLNSNSTGTYYHQPNATVQIQQVALDFSKFSKYTKSKYATQIANLELELATQQLMINVAQAYFDVLYAVDTLAAVRINKEAFAWQMGQAKQAYDIGTVTIVDVNDAKSSYDNAVADEIQAENDLISKKKHLS